MESTVLVVRVLLAIQEVFVKPTSMNVSPILVVMVAFALTL
jgi:hypothetical protein